MEELKKPNRDAPLAAIASILGVIIVYLLTNVSYFTVLTPQEMVRVDVVALAFSRKTLGSFTLAIPLCVSLCTVGALNSFIMGGSRVQFAAARDGLLPGILGMIHVDFRTPWVSLIFVCLLSLVYTWYGDALSLIEYVGFVGRFINFLIFFCILYLRKYEPHRHRPIKSPVVLTSAVFFVNLVLLVMGIYRDPRKCGLALFMYFSGIPVYFIYVKIARKSRKWLMVEDKLNLLSQKSLLLIKAS